MTAPAVALALLAAAHAGGTPDRTYYVFVASEGVDRIQLVSFGPGGAKVERAFRIGVVPTEAAGPHGLGMAPGGRSYFVSTGHGTPFGSLWKYASATDRPEGRVELGPFPASLQASPDGHFVYVVNFNLHGEMVPSSVSVVAADEMVEVARIPTCTMPHGSRLTRDGTRHYSACMMDDLLVEIDTRALAVARRLPLGPAHDGPAASGGAHPAVVCSPTWAQPSPDGRRVYVACNKANEILEIDAGAWVVRRRFQAGDGVYNLATTRDGRLLIASNKRGQSVSVFDAASGKELKRLGTRRKVVHGVAVSPDDRYAFVSVEGVGAEPGTVEMIDLTSLATVATVDVGPMAGGIDVWKVE